METVVDLQLRQDGMDSQPIVSVIIIFLNAERFIEEAIKSVFAQTYSNWELLLVDDGSSDKSTVIAKHYTEHFPARVHYFEHRNHQNCGKTASRNLGVCNVKGEYIAFLDSDDIWLPQKLEQQVAILDSHPEAAMVYGLSQWWYGWTGKAEDKQRDFVHELGVAPNTLINPPDLISLFFLTQQAAIPNPSNILLRHKIIEQVRGFDQVFQGKNDIYEDQAFVAKICLKSVIFASNECWDKYRQHSDSSSAVIQETGQGYSTRLFFLSWLEQYLSDQAFKNEQISKALRREIWRCVHPNLHRWWALLLELQRLLKDEGWKPVAFRLLPIQFQRLLWMIFRNRSIQPSLGKVHFGNLRRTTPFDRDFGFGRGRPIDRYYLEKFLTNHAVEIRGNVLEIGDDIYTRKFWSDHISHSEVLHIEPGNPRATLIADLTNADHIPSNFYDCIILTQTLQFIYDVHAVLRTIYRILKPGGVVLASVPGISPISRYDMERWGHFWSFTCLSSRRLFEEAFPVACVQVTTYGNVLAASAFLYGLAAQELQHKELDQHDPDYEVIITVRAVKPVES